MSTPTFVVGTGRCGSTMLSNMLREHPKVLSLSELFVMLNDGGRSVESYSPEPMDGRRFWEIIAARPAYFNFALRVGVEISELLYPYKDVTYQYSSQIGVPAILMTALPYLTKDHDSLFEILRAEVMNWPIETIDKHYRLLFGRLAEHFGKRLWIERSGGSLLSVEPLLAMFPDAKFIHVVRDGRDAAISMQKHSGFRLALVLSSLEQYLGVDPILSNDRTHIDRVPPSLRPYLPECFDLNAFTNYQVALPLCGNFWVKQVDAGLMQLRALPSNRVLTLRYEDCLADTKKQLDTLAAFLGEDYVNEDWSTRCAATVRPPHSTWLDLPDEEAHALTEACRPGFDLLCHAGVNYDL
jgi:putative sulfotransferase